MQAPPPQTVVVLVIVLVVIVYMAGLPGRRTGPAFPRAADDRLRTHSADDVWRAEKLAELDAPDATAPPPDDPRAKEVRGSVENRLRRARQQGKEDYETFTDAEALDFWKKRLRPADVPATVREAAELYRRVDPNRGWSWLGVFRVRAGGAGAFVIWCVAAGGGDGWLEVFDADGTPAGYGRTQDEVVFWRTKAAVRRSLFGERLDPELLAVRKRRS